ncbi:MAG TPA: aspartate carbamoyltransferase catalytic subunit [Candidatus Limnocylindrales bacterium]|nr:aspartate carbamoyltransferase catalytic subunit [Candidatus Limnocylindrales bacterium]
MTAGAARSAGKAPAAPPAWRHRHLLDVADLARDEIETLFALADEMAASRARRERRTDLAGRRVTTLFYEASTRTRLSFEAAARALGAEVSSVAVASSSVSKGESLVDTLRTLEALGTDLLVLRHARSGAPWLAARHFGGHVVNGGDGWHAHPTQALLDLYTLRARLSEGRVAGRKVVILGDVLHSRVARSNVWTLTGAGADLWLCGPPTLLRGFGAWARALPPGRRLSVTSDVSAALRAASAVMVLRLQRERMESGLLPSLAEYAARYGLTAERLRQARPDVVVLHPGPMNEGIEIAPEVAAGPRSVVADQVANGVPVRMALLALLAGTPG